MDDDRFLPFIVVIDVAQVESDGKLEIQLKSGTLMTPLQCISQCDIDLRTVKGSISRVQLPFQAHRVQGLGKSFFGFVPNGNFAQKFFWSGGQTQLIGESKGAVNVFQEVQGTLNFFFHLKMQNDHSAIKRFH